MLHENDNRNAQCFKMTSLGTIFNLKGLIHSFHKEVLIKSVMTCLGFKGNLLQRIYSNHSSRALGLQILVLFLFSDHVIGLLLNIAPV